MNDTLGEVPVPSRPPGWLYFLAFLLAAFFLGSEVFAWWKAGATERGDAGISLALDALALASLVGFVSVIAYERHAARCAREAFRNRERQQAEESGRRHAISTSVLNAMRDGVMVTDPKGRVLTVNPAFTRITGFGPDDAVGHGPGLVRSARHDDAFYEAFSQAIRRDGEWRGEMWSRRKDGSEFPGHLTVTTLRDEAGAPLHRVAVFSDITEEKQSAEMLFRQANFDALTGLPNRSLLGDRLDRAISAAAERGETGALLVIDMDRLKEVNDVHGHATGDRLLVEAAARLGGCLAEGDLLARLGGDSFAIVIPDGGKTARVESLIARLLNALATPFSVPTGVAYHGASVGVAFFPDDAAEHQTLLRLADQAMHRAKAGGGGTFRCYAPEMQRESQERVELANDLHGALGRGELELWYQPILDLATGRLCKAEALLRWRHPTRGFVSPARFIPIAEETGLIHEIGDWVFREAAHALTLWCRVGAGHTCQNKRCRFQVGINMSPRQFVGSGSAESWAAHLGELGVCPKSMNVEITEGLLLEESTEVHERLMALRDAGFELSIDDFGTGYSSLSYLRRFRIDYVKIDGSFIRDLEHDEGSRAIVEAMIVMARKLGLKVVAEGIETPEQLALLKSWGCDYGQGYHFHRPMPGGEFVELLSRHLKPRRREVRPLVSRTYPGRAHADSGAVA